MRESALAVLILTAILAIPAAARAEVSEVRVGVDGMICVT